MSTSSGKYARALRRGFTFPKTAVRKYCKNTMFFIKQIRTNDHKMNKQVLSKTTGKQINLHLFLGKTKCRATWTNRFYRRENESVAISRQKQRCKNRAARIGAVFSRVFEGKKQRVMNCVRKTTINKSLFACFRAP